MKTIIAYDLGTGGMKASLFNAQGDILESSFVECDTYYPRENFREQCPKEWWDILKKSTSNLIKKMKLNPNKLSVTEIVAIGISGHSLGVVPLSKTGELLANSVPIWSDTRAEEQQTQIFKTISESDWYLKTGNGFPAKLYSAFKILWYKENEAELYDAAGAFIGTKDYLNYLLTGVVATDPSYASGSGVYDLQKNGYDRELISQFGLKESDFPKIIPSAQALGPLLPNVAQELGLPPEIIVSAGGVDNACMAAGAGCIHDGMAYTSLGTSAWIAVCQSNPGVCEKSRPYVFAHLVPGKYIPAQAIFSAGNTFRWIRDLLGVSYETLVSERGLNIYETMTKEALDKSPVGSNGLFMAPHLAGATALDGNPNMKGAFIGLDLKHTKEDLVRASLEGICLSLKRCLNELEKAGAFSSEMLMVGGGAKSPLWRALFADIYEKNVVSSAAGENAGSLGAMATAAIAVGLWHDYEPLIGINELVDKIDVDKERSARYKEIFTKFERVCEIVSKI